MTGAGPLDELDFAFFPAPGEGFSEGSFGRVDWAWLSGVFEPLAPQRSNPLHSPPLISLLPIHQAKLRKDLAC